MTVEFDPGSFKDPDGRVFEKDGGIYRTLSVDAAKHMRALYDSGILDEFVSSDLLTGSKLTDASALGLDVDAFGDVVIEHERIPVITYPFEWPFEMLRDGALATLDLLSACLSRDLMLKDATGYNVAFHEGRMRFFDILSIEQYVEGTPWDGYAQFCREFLFPLMLTSYRGIEFQPWLRGSLTGLPVRQFARTMGWRDWLRPGILKHVVLQAKLEGSFAQTDAEMRGAFKTMQFSKAMIAANVAGLRKLVGRLSYDAGDSVWAEYAQTHSYDKADEIKKQDFVKSAIGRLEPNVAVDLGGNVGDYSLLIAPQASRVLCVDIDPACINTLYRRLRETGETKVVPIVGDLLNPTPSLGWALAERRDIFSRVSSDAFLALALVHHICISGNVPLDGFVDILRRVAPAGVVEWVDKSDAMVQRLLRNRQDVFSDYSWENFRAAVEREFTILETTETHGGARRLCLLTRRD